MASHNTAVRLNSIYVHQFTMDTNQRLVIPLTHLAVISSRPGTWRISAHYEGDEKNAATREFKVQKFGKTELLLSFTILYHQVVASSLSCLLKCQQK